MCISQYPGSTALFAEAIYCWKRTAAHTAPQGVPDSKELLASMKSVHITYNLWMTSLCSFLTMEAKAFPEAVS